jgi:nicotinamide-nucleotide amidase
MTKAAKGLKELMVASPALTLAVAESLTCGHLQALAGEPPGASLYFRGGVTTYTLDEKVRQLGVDRVAARKVDAVSPDVARQMAQGVCRLFRSDLGVATTGYAEPSPAKGVTVPFAFWALAHRGRGRWVAVRSGRVECPGANRTDAQRFVAEAVLAELVAYVRAWRAE